MSEPIGVDSASTDSSAHPGRAIRAAREARGQSLLHLSVLLKITERRLQAFEDGRWSDVGDTTFVRALAKSLCRHLEIDPAPVLQALPSARAEPRQSPDRGRLPPGSAPALRTLRSPIRLPGQSLGGRFLSPTRVAVMAILCGALVLVLSPSSWWGADPAAVDRTLGTGTAVSGAPAPEAVPAPVGPSASDPLAPSATTEGVPVAVEPSPVPAMATPSPSNAALQISVTQDSWVLVSDAQGQVLLSRLLRAGERVGVDGGRPLRLRVGNAAGTEAVWLGQPVPLQEMQRNNVADLQLP